MATNLHPWLRPLVFRDGHALPNRIIPGPMDGVTEGSYVRVMSRLGLARCWFTPFIRISNGVPRNAKLLEKLAPYLDTGLPVIAQIMGTHADILAETARRLHRLGACCVDLNCACPSQTVVGSGSGGYALTRLDWVCETLTKMKAACGNGAVSVKIRCGFSGADEIPDIAAALRQAAPDMVTCHFRTVRELYRPVEGGPERLASMHQLLPGIPFIGSGDLFTLHDAQNMLRTAGVDGVAPARGLLKNPGILREIEADCRGEQAPPPMDEQQLMAFLNEVGDASGQSRRKQGFLLKIAKVMAGEDSPLFQQLLNSIDQR